jgi:uncharacterized membrane protein YphA (DoxX/SURF4 family)
LNGEVGQVAAEREPCEWPRAVAAGLFGCLLLAAGVSKSAAPASASLAIRHVRSALGWSAGSASDHVLLAGAVCLEIALGAWLLSGLRRTIAAWAMAAFMIAATAMALFLVLDPAAPSCGCFGALRLAREAAMENRIALVRNLLLLSAALWVATAPRRTIESGGVGSPGPTRAHVA